MSKQPKKTGSAPKSAGQKLEYYGARGSTRPKSINPTGSIKSKVGADDPPPPRKKD